MWYVIGTNNIEFDEFIFIKLPQYNTIMSHILLI